MKKRLLRIILIAFTLAAMLIPAFNAVPVLASTTLNISTAAAADEIDVTWSGSAWQINQLAYAAVGYITSGYYKAGNGLRFTNITVPHGATITSAYLEETYAFKPGSPPATVAHSKIRADNADNSGAWSTYADYSGRTRTTTNVTWDFTVNTLGAVDTVYDSPDISAVIQVVVDRANWSSGNALSLFWDDHDDLSAHTTETRFTGYGYGTGAYQSNTGKQSKLHIVYTYVAAPTVTTGTATNIGGTVVTGNGNITNNNGANSTVRGFVWGTTQGGAYPYDVHDTGSYSTGVFDNLLTGLTPSLTYYYKAYATNSAGTGFGAEVSFVAEYTGPTITVQAATSVTTSTATGNGNITNLNSGGNCDERGFEWGTVNGIYPTSVTTIGSYGTGTYTGSLVSMPPGTTIYYRAKAHNSLGWGYSAGTTFITTGTAYGYRREITITGSSDGVQTNYQERFDVRRSPTQETYQDFIDSLPFTNRTLLLTHGVNLPPTAENLADPIVLVDKDDSSKLVMFFTAWDSTYGVANVCRATANASDPYTWTVYPFNDGVVLSPGQGLWDQDVARVTCVIVVNDEYWMYYQGERVSSPTHYISINACLATSADGINFTKYAGNPISGSPVMSPWVIYENSVFYFYWSDAANIHMSTSIDGKNFTGNTVVKSGSLNSTYNIIESHLIFHIGNKYVMTFDAYNQSQPPVLENIAIANSPTGPFVNYVGDPIFAGSGVVGSFDKNNVSCAFIFWDALQHQFLFFYQGSSVNPFMGPPWDIGVASGTLNTALNEHVKNDFTDVKFTAADGQTPLDFWKETYTSSSAATFWVKVPSIPAWPSTVIIYMYYDYPAATDTSNGTNTFQFFEDFTAAWPDGKWSADTGNGSVTSGVLTFNGSGTAFKGILGTTAAGDVSTAFRYRANILAASTGRIGARVAPVVTSLTGAEVFCNTIAPLTNTLIGVSDGSGNANFIVSNPPVNSFATYDIEINTSATAIFTANDNSLIGSPLTALVPNATVLCPAILAYNANAGLKVDWILNRKWTPNEPGVVIAAQDPAEATDTVVTVAATDITASSMSLNGQITVVSYVATQRGFRWGTTTGVYPNSWSESGTFGIGSYTHTISSLNSGTTYYYEAMIQEGSIWYYGSELTAATTSGSAPTITTSTATNVTTTTATLQGIVGTLGSYTPIYGYFETGTSVSYGTTSTKQTITTPQSFSQSLTGLTSNTIYHFRAVILYGGTSLIYGSDVIFTTPGSGNPGISPPDILQIIDTKVITGYLTPGDQLYLVSYDITYSTGQPTLPASNYFVIQILNNGNIVGQWSVPTWGYAPVGLYLNPTSALPFRGLYTIKIVGITNKWVTPPSTARVLTVGDWLGTDLIQIDFWVIATAQSIQTYYSTTLLTYTATGTVLNSAGSALFNQNISGLSSVRPQLFGTYAARMTPKPPVDTGTSFIDTWNPATRLGPYLNGLLISGAGNFGHPEVDPLTGLEIPGTNIPMNQIVFNNLVGSFIWCTITLLLLFAFRGSFMAPLISTPILVGVSYVGLLIPQVIIVLAVLDVALLGFCLLPRGTG